MREVGGRAVGVFIGMFARSTVSRWPSGSSGMMRDSDMLTLLKVAETISTLKDHTWVINVKCIESKNCITDV